MKSADDLRQLLQNIDRKSYPAYKGTKGVYRFGKYALGIDHVQGDPFAAPSSLHIEVSGKVAAFPERLYDETWKRIALEDYLIRQFGAAIGKYSFQAKGSGKSGIISVTRCGQEILKRSACEINPANGNIRMRFEAGFPANGRTINARELSKILFDYLPECVESSLFYARQDKKKVERVMELSVDQQYIRKQLKEQGLVAFVADKAVLPRESGVSAKPMKGAVPFASPESMKVTMDLPYAGKITGMGIKKGITLIVGGGYHGKSTLLKALEMGVYPHIAGDGREYVITESDAVKIRAEDGRSIKDTDISMFINDLPNGKDTKTFSTEDASGSTSQAANVVEAMEAGAAALLIDEDTSATNFMVRDELMQRVIHRDMEPITPFIERMRDLYENQGISTILVAGSSGAFFHIADTVIQMDSYYPLDITHMVKTLCSQYPLPETSVPGFHFPKSCRIMTKAASAAPRSPRRDSDRPDRLKTKVHGKDGFSIGRQEVDLRYIEQIVDTEQTASLSMLLKYAAEHLIDGKRTLPEIAEYLIRELDQKGLVFFSGDSYIPCGYAMPRAQEIYSCLNRYRRP
mgnify:CR=1 FL=1